jgi:hypothetical protein
MDNINQIKDLMKTFTEINIISKQIKWYAKFIKRNTWFNFSGRNQ